ncbi:hypothetical protein SVIOM342S_00867 [Streptomyces violaceorubidus]
MVLRTDTYGTRGASGVMDGLVEFKTEDGVRVVVEGVEDEDGARLVSRGDGPARAARTSRTPWMVCGRRPRPRCGSSGTARSDPTRWSWSSGSS